MKIILLIAMVALSGCVTHKMRQTLPPPAAGKTFTFKERKVTFPNFKYGDEYTIDNVNFYQLERGDLVRIKVDDSFVVRQLFKQNKDTGFWTTGTINPIKPDLRPLTSWRFVGKLKD